jgi:hypothetical protein
MKHLFKSSFLLLALISFNACDKVNSDSEVPILNVESIKYFKSKEPVLVAIEGIDPLENPVLETDNESLTLIDLGDEENLLLRYQPGDLNTEVIDFSILDGDEIIGRATTQFQKFEGDMCIRESFSDQFTYSHSNNSGAMVVDLLENDELCDVSEESTIILFLKGCQTNGETSCQNATEIAIWSTAEAAALFTFLPTGSYTGHLSYYFEIIVIPQEVFHSVVPVRKPEEYLTPDEINNCTEYWQECLTEEEKLELLIYYMEGAEQFKDPSNRHLLTLYSNDSLEVTVVE